MSANDHTTAAPQLRKAPSDATLQGIQSQLDDNKILEKEREYVGASEPPEEYDEEGDFPDGGTRAWMVVFGVRSANLVSSVSC